MHEALKGADDGLAARFLHAWPKVVHSDARATLDVAEAIEALRRLGRLKMAVADDGAPETVLIPATEEAGNLVAAFARDLQLCERNAAGLVVGALGRARGYALRLSTVLTHLRWGRNGGQEPTKISTETMRDSIRPVSRSYVAPPRQPGA